VKKSYKLSKKNLNSNNFNSEAYEKNKELFKKISGVKINYNLDNNQLLDLINKQTLIPISIFCNYSPLESLVKYLKENSKLSFKAISDLLNRDQRTIWVTYDNVLRKKINLDCSSEVVVPLEIFSDRKLSVLENLVSHLIKFHSLKEISKLLKKNYQTIWTCHNRAKKKNEK